MLLHFPKLKTVCVCVCVCVYVSVNTSVNLNFYSIQISKLVKNENINYSKAKQLCKHNNCIWSRLFYFYMHSYIQSSILIQLKKTSNAFELLLCVVGWYATESSSTQNTHSFPYMHIIWYILSFLCLLKRDSIYVHFVLNCVI